ncbi:MAG: DNA repair protein RecN [Acidimicrobiales bacterium]
MSSDPTSPVGNGRLVELAVTDLGIIHQLSLVLGSGMTALTGETGAGKTLVVGAIDLLLGGRADNALVRRGAKEAVVEGRFEVDGEELILTRVVPAEGRSRAYVNGHMATASALAQQTAAIVDLHGQHAHQSLLSARVQREALDRFAGTDLGPLHEAGREVRRLTDELEGLGGDAGARAREVDLLRFQLGELEAAQLVDPDEDAGLDEREDVLAGAVGHREAALAATAALVDDGGAADAVGLALAAVDGHAPFAEAIDRLRSVSAELADLAIEVRRTGEGIDDDPEALAAIRERRQLLVDLRRKYGSAADGHGTLADVIAYRESVAQRLHDLERHDARAAALQDELAAARRREASAAEAVAATRRGARRALATAVEANLAELAMAAARFDVAVGAEAPGDDVSFLLAANPGTEPAPLAKVASGGELARAMLALRLVLSAAPAVLVFDEVDAGIGGEAARAVGRALAELGAQHQVLVVTHLPQVAAFADHQVHVSKAVRGRTTVSSVAPLDAGGRVVELSRMLSGSPDSETTREAAAELLTSAAAERRR